MSYLLLTLPLLSSRQEISIKNLHMPHMDLIRRETPQIFLVQIFLSSPTWNSTLSTAFFFFNVERAGEMAQKLQALTILLEDLGLILNSHNLL